LEQKETLGESSSSKSSPAKSHPAAGAETTSMKKKKSKPESPGPSKNKGKSGDSSASGSKKCSSPSEESCGGLVGKYFVHEEASASGVREAPTFYPTDLEFEDPLKYIQKIQAIAGKFGMARIVPPRSFRVSIS
jgi:hypothetical protein